MAMGWWQAHLSRADYFVIQDRCMLNGQHHCLMHRSKKNINRFDPWMSRWMFITDEFCFDWLWHIWFGSRTCFNLKTCFSSVFNYWHLNFYSHSILFLLFLRPELILRNIPPPNAKTIEGLTRVPFPFSKEFWDMYKTRANHRFSFQCA